MQWPQQVPAPLPDRDPRRGPIPGVGSAPHTLIPRPPVGAIARPGLDGLLQRATTRRLTTVCAGPGWGKTLAVAGWLQRRTARGEQPAAWLTARPQSNDLTSFWDDVLGALRSSGAVPADHPLLSLSATAGISEEVLVSILVGLESLPSEVLLVVDDFQEISDRAVLESVTTATERAGMLRILLLSRIVPALPLHRLRLAGELSEVTADDLAFTGGEVGDLARAGGLELTPAQVELVLERAEGWPAGIRLALLSASRHGPAALASFAGTERSVAEYLVSEVLARHDAQTQEFLLRTSVAQQVCADLARALAPEVPAQRLLEQLEGRNEFVTALGSDRVWYRFHPLLRDLLEHTLRRDDPAAHRSAHRGAARWWADHADPIQALGHAADAQDWDLFGRIYVTGAGPSLVGVHRAALASLLHRVPYATLPDTSSMHLQQAGLALMGGHLRAMSVHVERARQLMAAEGDPQPGARVLTELMTCAEGRYLGDASRVVLAGEAAIDLLDSAGPMPAEAGYRAIAVQNLGVGQLWSGGFPAAARSFREVLSSPAESDVDLARLGARTHLGLLHAAQADLDSALMLACQAQEEAAARGWTSLLQARPAHLATALVHLLRGDADAAHAEIASGLAAVVGGAERASTLMLHALHTEVAVSQGRARGAEHSVREALASAQGWQPEGFVAEALAHAVTEASLLHPVPEAGERLLAGLRPDTPVRASCIARRLLASADTTRGCRIAEAVVANEDYETVFDLVALVEAWLVVAMARDRAWSAGEARAATRRAVELARPQGLIRPFLVTRSARMPVLLAQAVGGTRDDDPFASAILDRLAGPGPATPEPDPLAEPLTERELVMLRSLPSLRSNTEIAAEFYVSVNTVKTHLKGLYRKLGVSSRREAVERARELGLLG
ncbi:MAG: LuxR C-terminal-related transcriptional regulator [Candidatus Nanopelagicales bacterium]